MQIDLNIENYDHFGFYTQGIYVKIAKMKHRTNQKEVACIYNLDMERNGQELIQILEILKNCNTMPKGLLKYYGHSQSKIGVPTNFYFFEPTLLSLTFSLTLKEVLNEKRIKEQSDFIFIFETLLNTFAFLQKLNINFREFKPSNILFSFTDEKMQIKLNIFSLCMNVSQMQQGRVQNNALNQEESLYAAPEFQRIERSEKNISRIDDIFKADAYSFGLFMLELIRSNKFDNTLENLDQRLKVAIEEVERMRISEDFKLLILFLKADPKYRTSFREAFLRKVEKNSPDKYNEYLQNLKDLDKTRNLIITEDNFEEPLLPNNQTCFKKTCSLLSTFFSKLFLIIFILLFFMNLSSLILWMEFYHDLPFFEQFFGINEDVYNSILAIIAVDSIKSIIILVSYISLFGSFYDERRRSYYNFACFTLLAIMTLIHFFYRMVFLLGDDNFIENSLEKMENVKDNFHPLYSSLNTIYKFEIFLALFIIIEFPWLLQITIWNIEKLRTR